MAHRTKPETSPVPSPVVGMYHAGVSVADLDRSIAFYTELIGLELVWRRDADEDYLRETHGLPFTLVRLAFLRVPGSDTMVELLEYRGVERAGTSYRPSEPGTGHMCLLVRGLDEIHARLREAGVRARSAKPVLITAGRNKGSRIAYFHDPDGYPVELLERPESAS